MRRDQAFWLVAVALLWQVLNPPRAQTQDAPPPPLRTLVDVGGYRVVQPEVAKFTRVCAYDHSGIAWSDPGPPDSCALRVGEIHTALSKAKIAGPYVLVGHSLGALVSRLYAATYPDEVAGMVIDHAIQLASAVPPLPRIWR